MVSKKEQVGVRAKVGGAVGGTGVRGVSVDKVVREGRRRGRQHRVRRRRGQGWQRRQRQGRKQRSRSQVAGGDGTAQGQRRDVVEGGGGAV